MANKIEIGRNLYLFSKSAGKNANDLVITAHGSYKSKDLIGTTVPSGVTLHFLVRENFALKDPGLDGFLKNRHNYIGEDKYAGQAVRNYELTKYQGKHSNDAETYMDIATNVDSQPGMGTYNVLTVRNRWSNSTVTLKDMFEELRKNGHSYIQVYCSFCRVASDDASLFLGAATARRMYAEDSD